MTTLPSCWPFALALVAPQSPAAPEPPARVVLTLAVKPPRVLQLTVENAAVSRASFAGETYLVLRQGPLADERSYWAELETELTPSGRRAVPLAPRARATRAIRPEQLTWSEDRSGFGPQLPLGRMVPPGAYRAQVAVQAPDGGWWRSNEVDVDVGPSGTVRYR